MPHSLAASGARTIRGGSRRRSLRRYGRDFTSFGVGCKLLLMSSLDFASVGLLVPITAIHKTHAPELLF